MINVRNNEIKGVTFIIPTWNKKDLVVSCVSLLDKCLSVECLGLSKEIIVVDNGSTDNSYQALLKLKTKTPLRVIKLDNNLGFARAVNLAVKDAKYNYVYLLNNDMEVQPGFFKEIIGAADTLLKNSINFFALSSQIFFHDSSTPRVESGKTWTSFKHGKLLVGHELDPQKLKGLSLTAYAGGGSSLVSVDLFNRLGGFDHSVYTPMYGEDLDLGFVAWKKGYPSFFCPNSHVIHHHRSSSKLLPVSPDYYLHKNFLSFCLKNLNSFTLKFQIFLFYPFYLVFKKDYWRYLLDNLKNYQNIVKSKKKLNNIQDIFSDIELINFTNFEIKYLPISNVNFLKI